MKPAKYFLFPFLVVFTIFTFSLSGMVGPIAARATAPTSQLAVTVKIDNFTFKPKELEIPAGTTVIWQNADDVPHTATSKGDPQVFDSGALDTDEKFSFTFKTPGKYAYYCKVHPHMTGVITVH